MSVRELLSRRQLVAAAGGDAFARLDPPTALTGWALDAPRSSAVAYVRTSARRSPSLTAWGAGVVELLTLLRDAGVSGQHGIASVTAPFEVRGTVTALFDVGTGGDWEWMWTSRAPEPAPGEDRLIALDDRADAARIEEFGYAQNPRFEGFAGTGHSEGWLAALDGPPDDPKAPLLACGAIQRLPSGVAHLGGIVVARHARRRGLGRAISAALTRRVIEAEGVCTLGLYSDNAAAHRLYDSLGYATDKRWHSRLLAVR